MCLWSCFFSWGRRFRTHLFIYSLLFAKALSMHNTGSHAPNNACNQRSVSLYANIALHRHPPRIEWKLCVREFVCVWERASIAERRRRTTRERWRRYTCVQLSSCIANIIHVLLLFLVLVPSPPASGHQQHQQQQQSHRHRRLPSRQICYAKNTFPLILCYHLYSYMHKYMHA